MNQTVPNLYPLWHIISQESKAVLLYYQRKYYKKGIKAPEERLPETIPIDYEKEMAKAPSRSRE